MKKLARNTTSILTKPIKTKSNLNVIIALLFLVSLNSIFHCTALPFDHIKKSLLSSSSTSSSTSPRFGNKHRSDSSTSRESVEGTNFNNNSNNNSMTSVLRQRKIRGGSDNGENDNNINITSTSSTQPQINESTTSDSNNDQVRQDQVMKLDPKAKVDNDYKPSKIRSAIFPIYGTEVKKFILMGAIKFFVIMALTLTRDTKDTLVVTQCGAEAIAFLKVRIGKYILFSDYAFVSQQYIFSRE